MTEFYINSKVESDNIICFVCEIQLHHWELSNFSVIKHLQHTKDCWRIRIRIRIRINKIRIIEIQIKIYIEIKIKIEIEFILRFNWYKNKIIINLRTELKSERIRRIAVKKIKIKV